MLRMSLSKIGLVWLIALVGVLSIATCSSWPQRQLLYFPQPKTVPTPTLTLATEAGDVLVSVHERPGENALIYFGGNADDVSRHLASLAADFPDYALYLPHYRGYGGSAGTPSEDALNRDALALYERVRAQHGHIVVIGYSLGSGIAARLTHQKPVARLVLVSPYDSILNVARHHFPALLVSLLLRDKYESWRYTPQIATPTLILMAERDDVIPNERSVALYKTFRKGVASLETIPEQGHGDIFLHPKYRGLLRRFINGMPVQ